MRYLSDSTSARILPGAGLRAGISLVALTVACLALVAPVAQAAPTQVNVRIEGKSETLFEGPIWTEGHRVRASSDAQARPCDGTNNHQHAAPGPTPTASAVDAMSIIGETFDAQWYGSSFDDYFLTRFGPDEQSTAEGAYWGILVNNVFTSVGGCQYELGSDNEILWDYDAFEGRPFLALLPVAAVYTSGPRPLTATAALGKPFEVEVLDYADEQEDTPPSTPERTGSTPEPGARVSPVHTAANGFERVESESSPTVVTDAQGKASITFATPGWHRIKATVVTPQGIEVAVRSNRLDVCVSPKGQSTCDEAPGEDQVRTPPPPPIEEDGEAHPPQGPIDIPPTEANGIVSGQPSGSGASPSDSMSSAFPTPSLSGPALPETRVTHSTKPRKRRPAGRALRVRCARVHRRQATRSRRASRKCKAGAPRHKSKHHPRLRLHGHTSP
jgi:Domain of unknown function (DUF4430)